MGKKSKWLSVSGSDERVPGSEKAKNAPKNEVSPSLILNNRMIFKSWLMVLPIWNSKFTGLSDEQKFREFERRRKRWEGAGQWKRSHCPAPSSFQTKGGSEDFYIFEALYDTHLKQFLTPRFTHAKKYGKDLKNFLKIGLRPTFFSEMCCRSFWGPVYTVTFRKFKNFDRSPYARLLSAIFAFLPKTDRHPLTGVGEVKRFK